MTMLTVPTLCDGGEEATSKTGRGERMDVREEIRFFGEEKALVPGMDFVTYRYPTSWDRQPLGGAESAAAATTTTTTTPSFPMVVGVLSVGHSPEPRNVIRATWAFGHHNVFFIVSGEWTESLEREFAENGDLLWVDAPESYRGVTAKVLVWLGAAAKHFPRSAVLKTDDDSYVTIGLTRSLYHARQDGKFLRRKV